MAYSLKIIVPSLCGVLLVSALLFVERTRISCTYITLGESKLCVEVVTTEAAITQGLSGRKTLGADGMLFSMPRSERYSFWMKGMHFPIDIVWINSENIVTEISYNLRPETYPTVFRPLQPVQQVLEVPAGIAQSVWIGKVLLR